MLTTDRFLKVLLTLLVVGVWSLLITNALSAYSSQAQARKQYGVWVADDKGNLVINGDGSAPLTAAGLVRALAETPRQGWRLHSVVFSTNAGGYTVIVER
jgi:TPP-dependent 2-oxoacid decarboxylase